VGRNKDMIIRGGFNVYPRELEEVMLSHPRGEPGRGGRRAAPSHGEEVKAFVVRTPGAPITEAVLIAWCRQNIAAYEYPRIVEPGSALPMTATGKILKRNWSRSRARRSPAVTAGARR
jgi:long-chain acyl-CoA synthetase